MTSDVTRAAWLEDVDIQTLTVNIIHENAIPVSRGPSSAEIDHGPRVCVSSAGFVRSTVPAVWSSTNIMTMVGDGFDIVVGVRIEVQATLTFVARSLNDVIQVRNNTRREESLAAVVEIDSPRIARAVRKDLERMTSRMVSPDSCIDPLTIFVCGPWFADARMGENTMATI